MAPSLQNKGPFWKTLYFLAQKPPLMWSMQYLAVYYIFLSSFSQIYLMQSWKDIIDG